MLLHLPIAILTTLSPIQVSDVVPRFDIAKECRFEGGTSTAFDRCSHDEAEALQQLQAEWPQFGGSDRAACLAEATVAGFASYVDLIICLEMAKHVSQETNPRGSLGTQPMLPEQPEMSIVDRTK